MPAPESRLSNPSQVPLRTVAEWAFTSSSTYAEPFVDIGVDAVFTGPSGRELRMPAFYDGDSTWRVRFNPGEVGAWSYRIVSVPHDPGLEQDGHFDVTPRATRGFLRTTPGEGWGFAHENGDPVFIFGDTVYHLFGMAHCALDVTPFLERRARQGVNLLRVRVPVSPYHPPEGYSDWQTRRTWPWGGSEQSPRFDQFNLDYFRTVDEVVRVVERLGLGLEMIMEAWGFEFPFNSRQIFTAEWEELWLRYLIARYDAFSAVWFWTPLNEYEHYPNGDWNYHYTGIADRWQMRISRWIKANAPHGHIVAAHNGPPMPPFAKRFAADPEAVDTIMFQEWGTTDAETGWLAAGIEESIDRSLEGWHGSAVLSEWGYERNPAFELRMPNHEFCGVDHTRRGAWRAVFRGMGIIHGFENTWGPWAVLDQDQPGMEQLMHLYRFVTEIISCAEMKPAPDLLAPGEYPIGHAPQCLASVDRRTIAVYIPVRSASGGEVVLHLPEGEWRATWFDPRTGARYPAEGQEHGRTHMFLAPAGAPAGAPPAAAAHEDAHRQSDWVLVLNAPGS